MALLSACQRADVGKEAGVMEKRMGSIDLVKLKEEATSYVQTYIMTTSLHVPPCGNGEFQACMDAITTAMMRAYAEGYLSGRTFKEKK